MHYALTNEGAKYVHCYTRI